MSRTALIALCSLSASCSLINGLDEYSFEGRPDATTDRGPTDAGVDAPEVSDDAPVVSDDAPDVSEDAPDVSMDAPDVFEDAPEVSIDAPEASMDAPEVSVDAPDARVDVADIGSDCGGCGLPAPRPVAPLSTSRVTVPQPRLSWVLPPGATGARVTLCRDRAMTMRCSTFDAMGTRSQPDAVLTSGVWFWRLQGRSAAGVGAARGPVWQFTVGADSGRSGVVDTSWGASPDLNGDGLADLVIAAPEANRLYVYRSPLAATSTPSVTITDGGDYVAPAGDVDGDGFADLVSERRGTVFVFRGSAAGIVSAPLVRLEPPVAGQAFGASIAGAGDVNGDGYADLVVGAPGITATDNGRAFLYFGGPDGPGRTPSIILPAPSNGRFGTSVAGAGDVDGNGLGDVIVAAPSQGTIPGTERGRVYLFPGRLGTGPEPAPTRTLEGPPNPTMLLNNGNYGVRVASAGDINGDGRADVLVAATLQATPGGNGQVYAYLGASSGVTPTPSTTLPGPHGGYFGDPLGGAGDVDGDGFGDVVIAAHESMAPGGTGAVGRAYLYLGSSGGTLAQISLSDPSPRNEARFGFGTTGLGDVDGDGFDDWGVGDPNDVPARVHIYLGRSSPRDTPAFAITAPVGVDVRQFGLWLARGPRRRVAPSVVPVEHRPHERPLRRAPRVEPVDRVAHQPVA
ncbi:MAG: VCBS repeat-containing protein [Deltaproteobacteria bacterium]|nr:VCBS repeat-containing protein [Myxococcales bacterium]MDP3221385.1 VCBS repeat-containing protein [Deltaproteobacteria bacterium]